MALDYAPAQPPFYRRRRFRRAVIALVLLSGAIVVAVKYGPWMQERFEYLRAQRACLTYTADTSKVVLSHRAGAVSGVDYDEIYVPGEETAFGYEPPEHTRLFALPMVPNDAVAFMHERRSAPGGERKLVILRVEPWSLGRLHFWSTIAAPAPIFSNARIERFAVGREMPLGYRSLRVFAGAPAADDPSRFTVKLEIDGQPATLEGQLKDAGALSLTLRRAGAEDLQLVIDPQSR